MRPFAKRQRKGASGCGATVFQKAVELLRSCLQLFRSRRHCTKPIPRGVKRCVFQSHAVVPLWRSAGKKGSRSVTFFREVPTLHSPCGASCCCCPTGVEGRLARWTEMGVLAKCFDFASTWKHQKRKTRAAEPPAGRFPKFLLPRAAGRTQKLKLQLSLPSPTPVRVVGGEWKSVGSRWNQDFQVLHMWLRRPGYANRRQGRRKKLSFHMLGHQAPSAIQTIWRNKHLHRRREE